MLKPSAAHLMNGIDAVQEAVHSLKMLASIEHPDRDAFLDDLLLALLPSLCSVLSISSSTFLATVERCLSQMLRLDRGIGPARDLAATPGIGGAVKVMLTEARLKKLASMPLTSALDVTVDEDY
jgi:hypothetical protein